MISDDDHIGEFEIVASGEPYGTTVRDLKTGAFISGVQSIDFRHDAGSLPQLTIRVIGEVKLRSIGKVHHSQARYLGRPSGKTTP